MTRATVTVPVTFKLYHQAPGRVTSVQVVPTGPGSDSLALPVAVLPVVQLEGSLSMPV